MQMQQSGGRFESGRFLTNIDTVRSPLPGQASDRTLQYILFRYIRKKPPGDVVSGGYELIMKF
jgi:hypothetical protein